MVIGWLFWVGMWVKSANTYWIWVMKWWMTLWKFLCGLSMFSDLISVFELDFKTITINCQQFLSLSDRWGCICLSPRWESSAVLFAPLVSVNQVWVKPMQGSIHKGRPHGGGRGVWSNADKGEGVEAKADVHKFKNLACSNCRLVPYWREFLGVSWSRTPSVCSFSRSWPCKGLLITNY